MQDKTGRVPVVKTTAEQRARWDWTTVPMAHSPQGFAELPYPWQEAKAAALKAHQAAVQAPIPPVSASAAPVAARPNLADLVADLGPHHAAPRQHNAALYQMLFHALRDRPVSLLKLLATPPEACADDLPAARLWLDYFPQGDIHVLDAHDLTGVTHDRFCAHRADPDDQDALRAAVSLAVAESGGFDIILDNASHASHHQQTAFLALFVTLKPNGLYIIDNLRSQPGALEKAGITRTAALFRGLSQGQGFRHSNPVTEAAFAALAPDISGCVLTQVNFDKNRRDQVAVIQKR